AAEEEDEEDEVPTAPTPPSPTHEPTPPSQEPITSPSQAPSVTVTPPNWPAAEYWADDNRGHRTTKFVPGCPLRTHTLNNVKTTSTPIETQKPLVKDEEAADSVLSRFQVTPKTSHLQDVKRIFRYLKGQLKLGLWYPKVSSFNLEAYSDSDYAGANLDRKSTTGGC
nr:retrovirus-related Pol polyprotein from transposon TNT 1-94 [Tanacetum cinerariifolium]